MDATLNLLISTEQYNFLNAERGALNDLVGVGHLRNLNREYLRGAALIYAQIYKQQQPNIFCPDCIRAFLRPLHYQLTKYETVHV